MGEQIRIAPDRTGEVCIGTIRQAKVSDVVGAVDGLLHGAQHHGLQQDGIRPQFDLGHQLGIVGRRWLAATAKMQTYLFEEGTELI